MAFGLKFIVIEVAHADKFIVFQIIDSIYALINDENSNGTSESIETCKHRKTCWNNRPFLVLGRKNRALSKSTDTYIYLILFWSSIDTIYYLHRITLLLCV